MDLSFEELSVYDANNATLIAAVDAAIQAAQNVKTVQNDQDKQDAQTNQNAQIEKSAT